MRALTALLLFASLQILHTAVNDYSTSPFMSSARYPGPGGEIRCTDRSPHPAQWLSLFDSRVLQVDDHDEPEEARSAATQKFIMIVGGMQNLDDYQGNTPIPVLCDLRDQGGLRSLPACLSGCMLRRLLRRRVQIDVESHSHARMNMRACAHARRQTTSFSSPKNTPQQPQRASESRGLGPRQAPALQECVSTRQILLRLTGCWEGRTKTSGQRARR